MIEEWRDIKNYEALYQISSLGNVRSLNYNRTNEMKYLKKSTDNNGYDRVFLYKKGEKHLKLIHRLVATNFIKVIVGKEFVNHINGIKNDNRIENLEWCTRSENQIHAYKIGLQITNKNMINARKKNIMVATTSKRKKVLQLDENENIIKEFESVAEAIKITGINHISDCALKKCKKAGGYIWKYKET